MARIGKQSVTLVDREGDPLRVTDDGKLDVNAISTAVAFETWKNYPDFEVEIGTSQALNHANHCNESIDDAKEIILQTDDNNTEYVMVGYTQETTLAGDAGSRAGIKLNGGETLVLSWSTFATIFLIASTSSQYINVAYFK